MKYNSTPGKSTVRYGQRTERGKKGLSCLLPPWIIERIKEQERRKREEKREQPALPLEEGPLNHDNEERKNDDEGERGVAIIEL